MQVGTQPVGFIGLGTMGEAMALNLAGAGTPLLVWNRTAGKTSRVAQAGAAVAEDVGQVFARCRIIVMMLADDHAIDAILSRGHAAFTARAADHVLVHMGTTSPAFSRGLEKDIRSVGGHYVEAPVSGSRQPAEAGQLIGMLAGETGAIAEIRQVLAPICRQTVVCGPVPSALLMKLAVNLFLISLVTGLSEAVHFAERNGIDAGQFLDILNEGPMASDVSRVKAVKLIGRDFEVQAAVSNVLENSRLIAEAARGAGIASPVLDICHALYAETLQLGFGAADMVAVLRAIERRSDHRE